MVMVTVSGNRHRIVMQTWALSKFLGQCQLLKRFNVNVSFNVNFFQTSMSIPMSMLTQWYDNVNDNWLVSMWMSITWLTSMSMVLTLVNDYWLFILRSIVLKDHSMSMSIVPLTSMSISMSMMQVIIDLSQCQWWQVIIDLSQCQCQLFGNHQFNVNCQCQYPQTVNVNVTFNSIAHVWYEGFSPKWIFFHPSGSPVFDKLLSQTSQQSCRFFHSQNLDSI